MTGRCPQRGSESNMASIALPCALKHLYTYKQMSSKGQSLVLNEYKGFQVFLSISTASQVQAREHR